MSYFIEHAIGGGFVVKVDGNPFQKYLHDRWGALRYFGSRAAARKAISREKGNTAW